MVTIDEFRLLVHAIVAEAIEDAARDVWFLRSLGVQIHPRCRCTVEPARPSPIVMGRIGAEAERRT